MRLARVVTIISALLLVLTATIANAGVIALPTAQVRIDGDVINIPAEFDPSEGGYVFGPYGETVAGGRLVNLDALWDPDPQLDYGFSFIDTGAPSTVTVTFLLPMVPPLAAATSVRAQISGSITDRVENGVSITPVAGDPDGDGIGEIQVMELGLPFVNAGVDVGPAASFTPASSMSSHTALYGPHSDGPQLGPPGGPFTVMRVTTSFTGSGDGDAYAFRGNAFAIPEPSTWVLTLMGVGIMLGACRRRLWN
jgi:hypothetical protein